MSNLHVRKVRKAISEELERINQQHDGLRPSVVVSEATPTESPIHCAFEWDDKTAGHLHRLQQARTLIRMVVPVVEMLDGSKQKDPFVWVPPTSSERQESFSGEGVYRHISVVMENIDEFARALAALSGKMQSSIYAVEEFRNTAIALKGEDSELLARISVAITALHTAGAAVQALH